MGIDDTADLFADILLPTLLLQHELPQGIRVILLPGVLNSHFKLFLFFFQFDVADPVLLY